MARGVSKPHLDHDLSSSDFASALLALRRELDAIDTQFVSLLAARFATTHRIGMLKATYGIAAADPAREEAQLERLSALSRDLGLFPEVTRAVYEVLFGLVRANHRARAELAMAVPEASPASASVPCREDAG